MSHLKAYCLYHSDQAITNFCKDSTPLPTQRTASCRCVPPASANTPTTTRTSRQSRSTSASRKQSIRSANKSMLRSRSCSRTMARE